MDNITGVAGKLVSISLHTNYSKKQNSKFPQSVFKISKQFTLFGYIYNLEIRGDGRCMLKLVRKPEGKVSVQRCKHGWDDNINMVLNLICLEN